MRSSTDLPRCHCCTPIPAEFTRNYSGWTGSWSFLSLILYLTPLKSTFQSKSFTSYSYSDLTYLIGAYENLKLYPEKNTDYICDQVSFSPLLHSIYPHLDKLSPLQHFYLINFITHSRTSASSSQQVIRTLLQHYTAPNSPSSTSLSGIRCALLRYTSVVLLLSRGYP